jgi:hypothetical protein
MNIFYLDKDPILAAEMSCDKHVCKMIIESAQMLSTAHRIIDGTEYYGKTANGRKIKRWLHPDNDLELSLYLASHVKHPSTIWVMQSAYNYIWLYRHMMALNEQFKLRYQKPFDHMTIQKLGKVLKEIPKNIPLNKIGTEPPPAMPDECKVPGDSIASYRKYYIMKKRPFATWRKPSKMPEWYKQGINENVHTRQPA